MDVLDVPQVLEEPHILRHRLTVEDYYRMAEVGVLEADARVELIEGEVIDMAPTGTKHYAAVMRLDHLIKAAVQGRALVAVQAPLRLNRYSQPEPDLAVLKPRDDFYAAALPTGADTLLVIEVSDTTLAYDVRIKAPLYARHGVAELWVIDLAGGLLRRFCDPQGDSFGDVSATERPGRIALPGLIDTHIDLSGLF